MPDLNFQITGVEAVARGVVPLLHFGVRISVQPANHTIHRLFLNAQIQIQSPQRRYTPAEKKRLFELFGPPEGWGQTLESRLWAHTSATVGAFTDEVEAILPVPCTYDLNLAATKYFYALEGGEVPLLFLFSGPLFYPSEDGRLQVEAVVEAVEQDLEKKVHLAVVFEDDPGRDLGRSRQPGHRFFFGIDEVEPLGEAG